MNTLQAIALTLTSIPLLAAAQPQDPIVGNVPDLRLKVVNTHRGIRYVPIDSNVIPLRHAGMVAIVSGTDFQNAPQFMQSIRRALRDARVQRLIVDRPAATGCSQSTPFPSSGFTLCMCSKKQLQPDGSVLWTNSHGQSQLIPASQYQHMISTPRVHFGDPRSRVHFYDMRPVVPGSGAVSGRSALMTNSYGQSQLIPVSQNQHAISTPRIHFGDTRPVVPGSETDYRLLQSFIDRNHNNPGLRSILGLSCFNLFNNAKQYDSIDEGVLTCLYYGRGSDLDAITVSPFSGRPLKPTKFLCPLSGEVSDSEDSSPPAYAQAEQ